MGQSKPSPHSTQCKPPVWEIGLNCVWCNDIMRFQPFNSSVWVSFTSLNRQSGPTNTSAPGVESIKSAPNAFETSAVEWIEFQGRPVRLSAMIGHRLFYLHTSLAKVGQTGHVSNAILLNTIFFGPTQESQQKSAQYIEQQLFRPEGSMLMWPCLQPQSLRITDPQRQKSQKTGAPPSSKKNVYLKNNKYAIKCYEVACCINMMGANIL